MKNKEDRVVIILLLIYYTVMVSLAFIAKGTGDDGDSVLHFLYARDAYHHPENFLHQWAKPLYVFIAAPFAQFGFTGIKIFTVTVSVATIYFSYRCVKLLQISNAWFVAVSMCLAPMYIHLSLSGLTEPLFALALIIVIFLALKGKQVPAALLVSFLPFLRSEGLIILCVYVFYLLFKKSWKLIPLLAAGHVVYSVTGYFYYKDFLWVFNKLSYAKLYSVYGQGSPLVFVYGLVDYLGWVVLIFFCIGVAAGTARFAISFFEKGRIFPQEEFWLVFGSFFSVWVGHMIFWTMGIFNSYGLTRVLIEVIPCAAIIAARGFSAVMDKMNFSFMEKKSFAVVVLALAAVIIQLSQLNWNCYFDLTGSQKAISKAASKYKGSFAGSRMYYTAPYVSVAFGNDLFDSALHRVTPRIFPDKDITPNSVIVWDDYYSKYESKVSLNSLEADDRLELLDTFIAKDCFGSDNQVAIFRYKGPDTIIWLVKDTLWFDDCETKNFEGRDSSASFSGKYSSRVDEQHQFSTTFDAPLDQLHVQLPATIQVSAMWFAFEINPDQYKQAQMVVSLEHDGKIYFWKGLDTHDFLRRKNTWTKISFKIKLPPGAAANDHLKIYVWNPHHYAVYVDDLQVLRLVESQ